MSTASTTFPAVTGVPSSASAPTAGSVTTVTLASVSPGSVSLKLNSVTPQSGAEFRVLVGRYQRIGRRRGGVGGGAGRDRPAGRIRSTGPRPAGSLVTVSVVTTVTAVVGEGHLDLDLLTPRRRAAMSVYVSEFGEGPMSYPRRRHERYVSEFVPCRPGCCRWHLPAPTGR